MDINTEELIELREGKHYYDNKRLVKCFGSWAIKTAIFLPLVLAIKLDKIAREKRVKRTTIIIQILQEYFDKQK